MDIKRKKELFPYFAYTYSQENNPEKYGGEMDYDQWYGEIQKDTEMLNNITEQASVAEDDMWEQLEAKYAEPEEVQTAKKGAKLVKKLNKGGVKLDKLKELNSYKKGSKLTKKCACGCDLTAAKAKGGSVKKGCPCCGK